MIVILLLVFGGIFGWKWYQNVQNKQRAQAHQPPPVTVTATEAKADVWQPMLQAVGTLRAVQGIDVSPEVAGIVSEIKFKSGQQVQQGDLLVQLDVSQEQAALKGLEAAQTLAQNQLKRMQELEQTQVNPPSELDQAKATDQQAQASVESEQALIAKKTIRAPFSGVLGIRQVDLGEYLSAGAKIVTLQALNPIYADFSLPQQDLSKVQVGQPVTLRVDTYPQVDFYGKITALNPKVNVATRSFAVQATLANDDSKLLPGMFGKVSVRLPQQDNVVTLPQTAISFNPYGDTVFVIQNGTNQQGQPALNVQPRLRQNRRTARNASRHSQGVQAGQQVVTSGQMKLQAGTPVQVDNQVAPVNQPSVSPPDE